MKFEIVEPLLGFEDVKEVELQKVDGIFMKLSSEQNKQVSFTLIDPFALMAYDFEVPDNIKDKLEISDDSNLLALNIILIQKPIEDSLVNFIAPLVFNTDNNKVAQVILTDTKYAITHKISDFLNK